MNKYQEAYGRIIDSSDLKIHVENGLPMNQDTKDVLLVQELVDKATPKKPIWDLVPLAWNKTEKLPFCPTCMHRVDWQDGCKNNNCRQAIDWSKNE